MVILNALTNIRPLIFFRKEQDITDCEKLIIKFKKTNTFSSGKQKKTKHLTTSLKNLIYFQAFNVKRGLTFVSLLIMFNICVNSFVHVWFIDKTTVRSFCCD